MPVSPYHDAGRGLEAALDAQRSQIGELRLAVPGQQHVARFDVAVQDSGPVCGLEGTSEFDCDSHRLAERQSPLSSDPPRDKPAGMIGHYQVRQPTAGGPDLQDLRDVRVAGQRAHRLLLAQEPLELFDCVPIRPRLPDRPAHGRLKAADDSKSTTPKPPRPTTRGSSRPVPSRSFSMSGGPSPCVPIRSEAAMVLLPLRRSRR